MSTIKQQVIKQTKADEKQKQKLNDDEQIVYQSRKKWLSKEERLAKRKELMELKKQGKEELERKQIIHQFVNSIIEKVISNAELSEQKCKYIRPKIRNNQQQKKKTYTRQYTVNELENMKGTFIGDIINSIYNPAIPKRNVNNTQKVYVKV